MDDHHFYIVFYFASSRIKHYVKMYGCQHPPRMLLRLEIFLISQCILFFPITLKVMCLCHEKCLSVFGVLEDIF
jgi:hypothetical protein